jgi:hypothetical protein
LNAAPSPPGAIRAGFALTLVASALALGACGSSGDDSANAASSDSDRDTAQLKLQECLRKNGVDLPRRTDSGSGGGQGAQIRRPSAADQQKMRKAMDGPCKALREKAFGNISAEDRQEMRDRMVKFTSCMRKHGVDLPEPPGPGGGGGPRNFSLRKSPKLDKATAACRKLLPRDGRGGPGGPGGGPNIQIGPPPGGSQ